MPAYVSNTTRRRPLPVPFSVYAKAILGKNYELSVTYITPRKMEALNRTHRKKHSSTDILSFSLGRDSGELYLSIPDIEKKAALADMNINDYARFLAVHGLVHLSGLDHGKKMTDMEKKFCKKFGIPHYNP